MREGILNKPLVPIWQAHYDVSIRRNIMAQQSYHWTALADANIGIGSYLTPNLNGYSYKSAEDALAGWKEFAEANLITNYTVNMP